MCRRSSSQAVRRSPSPTRAAVASRGSSRIHTDNLTDAETTPTGPRNREESFGDFVLHGGLNHCRLQAQWDLDSMLAAKINAERTRLAIPRIASDQTLLFNLPIAGAESCSAAAEAH